MIQKLKQAKDLIRLTVQNENYLETKNFTKNIACYEYSDFQFDQKCSKFQFKPMDFESKLINTQSFKIVSFVWTCFGWALFLILLKKLREYSGNEKM